MWFKQEIQLRVAYVYITSKGLFNIHKKINKEWESVPLRVVSSKEKALEEASMGQKQEPVIIIQSVKIGTLMNRLPCLTNVCNKIYEMKTGRNLKCFLAGKKLVFTEIICWA